VGSPKKFNVHLCQKVPFVLACFQGSDEKDALFGPDAQIKYLDIPIFCQKISKFLNFFCTVVLKISHQSLLCLSNVYLSVLHK
jgi:hypothetical protein